ncbi:MAG: hypothetical protein P8H59_01130 [Flavobacteriales bacterium]|nr:hypothetical protein [Flavobacteriales bacterium]MDG1779525.1 hypothetical protein [Flavobacteriales bacterium]MDG2247240.1 hypothetical protein [Flavobacteriales bacterium]
MKENTLILICGALWLLTKTVLHNFVSMEINTVVGVMLNMLLILVIAIFTINKKVKGTPAGSSHYLDDLKAVLRATSKYVLLAIVCLGVFNYGIARESIIALQQARVDQIEQDYSEENYKVLQETNITLQHMEREEAMTLAMDRIELFSKWYVQLTLSLIALLLAAILYSIIGSLLWRLMLR